MNGFKLLAFTHKTANLKSIGELHIDDTKQQTRLGHLKQALSISELLFLSTCNRVEFLFCCTQEINERFLGEFIQQAYPHFT